MTNYEKIYWLTRLDGFKVFLILITIACLVRVIIYYIGLAEEFGYNTDRAKYIKAKGWIPKLFITIGIVSSTISVFIPSKRDIIEIYAGGKTMDFVQSDSSINKIPAQTTKLITDYLQNQIDNTKK